jgi:inosose dehydratase
VDLPDLAPTAPYGVVLDEIARIGFAGCQFGRGFPEGAELRSELDRRALRLAELYCALPADADGLVGDAEATARGALDRLLAADGEMLVVALDGGGGRDEWAGRVPDGAARWPDAAFDSLAALLADVADVAPDGARVSFHPHAATWIEAPDEVDALASRLDGTRAGLCLDVGHYTVGGGDAVDAIVRHAELITHVHMKDVDPAVLARLRAGEISGFGAAVRERIFTELGNGLLDLDGVIRALERIGYGGWLMVEQDSSWLPPAEAAEIGLRALRASMAGVAR